MSLGLFVRFPFLTTPYVELRLLSVQRHQLTVETTRFKNRLPPEFAKAAPHTV